MVPQSTKLELKLFERIKSEGPMTFRDFMQAALYDAELGYYNTERLKIGAQGDFYTSSNVHASFGAILARAFSELWRDETQPLTIVEMGPGTGRLASDVLTAMRNEHPQLFERVTYVLVDSSPSMRQRQREALGNFVHHLHWMELNEFKVNQLTGLVFSNEFVDALPVHRIRWADGALEEMYVTLGSRASGPCLSPLWRTPSTNRLGQFLERNDFKPGNGQLIEINLDSIEWLNRIAQILNRGFLVTIDYGDKERELYAPERMSGTLRSFYSHRLIDSPFERVGEQDITASVNFTALIEYGRDFGLELVSYERQTEFLIRLGLIERIAAQHATDGTFTDSFTERAALKNLFVPGGVSDSFRVLIQSC